MEKPTIIKSRHSFAVACPTEKALEKVRQKFKHTDLWMTSDSIQGSTEKRKISEKWGSQAWLSYIFWWPKAVAVVLTETMYHPHSPAAESAGEKQEKIMLPWSLLTSTLAVICWSDLLWQRGNLDHCKLHATCRQEECTPIEQPPVLWGAH